MAIDESQLKTLSDRDLDMLRTLLSSLDYDLDKLLQSDAHNAYLDHAKTHVHDGGPEVWEHFLRETCGLMFYCWQASMQHCTEEALNEGKITEDGKGIMVETKDMGYAMVCHMIFVVFSESMLAIEQKEISELEDFKPPSD